MLVPKLRFKREDGTDYPVWEEQNLLQALIEKKEYNTLSSECPLLTSSRTGLMYQNEYRDNASTSNQSTLFSVVNRGDCTYRHMSDDSIFHFNINTLCDKGLVSKEYPVFTARNEFNLAFVVTHLNSSTRFLEFCRQQKKGGTRTRLYFKTLCNYKMAFPCLEEQQKIADFLSTVDEVIAQSEAEVQNLEQQKKAAMQKIFSQEVRFKREDGTEYPEWSKMKLNSILCEYKETCEKDGTYEHISLTKEGVVPKSERYERDFLVTDDSKKYRVTHLDDICYNPANLKFGVICRNKYGDGIFSPIYVTFKVQGDYLPIFVEMIVTREDFIKYALRFQQGTVYERMAVSPEDLLSITVNVPCLEEQQKIADFLSAYDEAIRYAKQELDKWKELKKGLLQQMFV